MAAPRPSRRATTVAIAIAMSGTVLAALGLAGSAPAVAAAGASTFENCSGSIKVLGTKGKAKFPKGAAATMTLQDVTITGCDMEIKANSASSPTFDVNDGTWILDGNVHIRSNQQQSRIDADHAVVQLANGEIQRLTITGTPAQFEQKRADSDAVTRGHARQIIYEAGPGIVSLVDDAWLSDGSGKTFESPGLWYDIRKAEMGYSGDTKGKAGGASGAGERVIITIDPKAARGAKKDDDKKAPSTPPPASQNNPSTGPSPAPTPAKP